MNVVVQSWTESEAGWGMRPDGVSVHRSDAARRAYIYEETKNYTGPVPHEYSFPDGNPYMVEADVPADVVHELLKTEVYGVRFFRKPDWLKGV